jgi:hypothetical protein
MVITMSDYLLEQEISTASCDDILMEQYAAAAEVNSAIAAAYAKEILMLEYASDAYLEEADSNGEVKESKFKKFWSTIWEAIKNFFKMIWQKLKDFGAWVKSIFKGKPSAKLREEYEEMTDAEAEALVKKITGDLDVKSDGKGGIKPHVYETEPTKYWIENFDAWCDLAEKILDEIARTANFHTVNLNRYLNELKDKSSALHNIQKKTEGPKKSAKATLGTMVEFLDWFETNGSTMLDGIRDKIQKMDSGITAAKEALDKAEGKGEAKDADYITAARKLHAEIQTVSADVLKVINEKRTFVDKVTKAVVDIDKAKKRSIAEKGRKDGETRAQAYKRIEAEQGRNPVRDKAMIEPEYRGQVLGFQEK